ncbi:hypothetical protein AVEN_224682-1 [Araneus ventricosus]|uniref:Uncharacterized protein n=1 Tax=Araneus ventricosus TaxID=182803 RepID=A0A4Y2LPC5_ARAVE|nr:hypothetical protein AVEN_224682-1 [Araneus ventricosus]
MNHVSLRTRVDPRTTFHESENESFGNHPQSLKLRLESHLKLRFKNLGTRVFRKPRTASVRIFRKRLPCYESEEKNIQKPRGLKRVRGREEAVAAPRAPSSLKGVWFKTRGVPVLIHFLTDCIDGSLSTVKLGGR